MKTFSLTVAVIFITSLLPASAAEAPTRPKITGVAYYSVFVSHLEKARRFYQEFLGYEEAFHLTKPDGTVRKAVLKVNDHQFIVLVNEPNRGEGQLDHYALQTNSVEQMRTYGKLPPPNERGGQHHFCLGVHDAPQSLTQLEACPARKHYPREMKIHFGVDNKRQISLRDPDGTRIEVMDIKTIDGKPAPSSKLPPPTLASAPLPVESSGTP